MIENILKVLTTPSDYEKDWYGYATNQISHIGVGMFFVWLFCAIVFWLDGELPHRAHVLAAVASIYMAKEIFFDRWQGLDTVEDFLFVVIYGAGGTLYSFKEIERYTADVVFNIVDALPFLVPCLVHLSVGVVYRAQRALNE